MRACADIAEHKAASLKIEVARLKDSITTREEVRRDAQAVSSIWIEEINRMREEAPGRLIGMDEVGVRAALDTLTDEMMDRIMDRMERL
jgi:ATP:corrinoid adenosyltransferase